MRLSKDGAEFDLRSRVPRRFVENLSDITLHPAGKPLINLLKMASLACPHTTSVELQKVLIAGRARV